MTETDTNASPEAIDVRDGIPDCASVSDRFRVWKVFGLYLVWIGALLYMLLGGLPTEG